VSHNAENVSRDAEDVVSRDAEDVVSRDVEDVSVS
jgi:hypothetical protein